MASSRKAKSLTAIIEALPIDLRDRVVERAAIIAESGTVDWEEADRLAYEMETGRSSPGLARASERPAAPSEQEAKSGTTKRR